MVRVNIWWPNVRAGNIGHASMQVNDVYISNWPGELSSVFLWGKGSLFTFDSDKTSEGGAPDTFIQIDGLDENAMVSWFEEFKRNPRYSLWFTNCCQTVGIGLCIGSPNPLHTRYFGFNLIHHVKLWSFASSLALSRWIP